MIVEPWALWLAIGATVAGAGMVASGAGAARGWLGLALLVACAAPMGEIIQDDPRAMVAFTIAIALLAREVLRSSAVVLVGFAVMVSAWVEVLGEGAIAPGLDGVLIAATLVFCAGALDVAPRLLTRAAVTAAVAGVVSVALDAGAARAMPVVAAAVFLVGVWVRVLPVLASAFPLVLVMLAVSQPRADLEALAVGVLAVVGGTLWWRLPAVMDRASFGRPHARAAVLALALGASVGMVADDGGVVTAAPLLIYAAAVTLVPLMVEDR